MLKLWPQERGDGTKMFNRLVISGFVLIILIILWCHKSGTGQRTAKPWNRPSCDLSAEVKRMDQLNGYDFEDYCAWLLKRNGFIGVKQTGKDHDCGLDLLAYRHHVKYGIQCKHYKKRKVNRHTIKQTADGAHYYHVQRAIVLTNSRFSREAVRDRKFFHVRLWNRRILITLIQRAMS